MVKSVWDKIGKKINALPKQVETAFLDATEEALTEEGQKLYQNLQKSGSSSLNAHLDNKGLTKGKILYTYEVEWSDELVNPNRKIKRERTRQAGKRDYGVAPATWNDLAYIINYGTKSDDTGKTIKEGNFFITKAMRNAKKWKKKQESKFKLNLDLLANKLKEDK